MWRYRLKVTLLALGVVLGYGSAFRHANMYGQHGFGHGYHHDGPCWFDWDRPDHAAPTPVPAPAK